ncbi:neural cell adhesion molecule 2-like isoform X2 [Dermacentor variabilis]|uniref:neural cell adhesion molecule 2-like isoform X2 n=1 Tax=Dermacentor variabilis TaxID=34621 RepID=UPI003F5BD8B3
MPGFAAATHWRLHLGWLVGCCLWISRPARAGEYPERSALVGGSASLPCNITPPTLDDAVALVLWYRGDSGTPIFSLDARNSPPDAERTFVDDSLGSRAFFNRSGAMATLQLQPVRDVDDGEYRCRVDYKRSRTQNRIVRLNVVVPPTEVLITNRTGEPLRNRPIIGPFNEGSSLTLVCKALGGRPPPHVTWWLGGEMVDDSYSPAGEGVIRNDLVIGKLQRSDLMATYRCQASNNNQTVPVSTSVSLDLNLRPLEVDIVTAQPVLLDGQVIDVECQARGAQPKAAIQWFLDDAPLNGSTLATDATRTTSVLHLEAHADMNGKRLACRGFNPHLPDSELFDYWVLDVHFKPVLQLNLVSLDASKQISEGSSVYFDCNVQANPPVKQVGWLHEGAQLEPSAGIRIENVRLVIDRLQRHQAGHYQCAATNELGHGVSEKVFLMVYYPPKCREKQKTVYHVARHEITKVTCDVEADPPDVRFTWRFNSSLESLDIVAFNQSGPRSSSAFYTPRRKADYGALLCIASNSLGQGSTPCVFNIVPAGPPNPPVNCSVPSITATSLTVRCERSLQPWPLPVHFRADVYVDSRLRERMVSNDPLFEVGDLEPGSSVSLSVFALNEKGISTAVPLALSTLVSAKTELIGLLPGEAAMVSASSPLLGILVGVVALLVLIAIVIIIVMKVKTGKRKAAAKRRNEDDKSHTPLKKEIVDITEVEDKCPDIIPPRNLGIVSGSDYSDIEMKYVETHITDRVPSYENGADKKYPESFTPTLSANCYLSKQRVEDLTYAELSLPPSTQSTFSRSLSRSGCRAVVGSPPLTGPPEPPTEYADIDFVATRAHGEARCRASQGEASQRLKPITTSTTTPIVSAVCSRVCVTPPLLPAWKPPSSRLSISSLAITPPRSDTGSSSVPSWTLSEAGGTLPLC